MERAGAVRLTRGVLARDAERDECGHRRLERLRDGGEASTQLRNGSWALIILDVMMPVKSGWDVLREMRVREVMVTGAPSGEKLTALPTRFSKT